ncbi:DUF389 domain-containing protein [bacterium]|nr:DUF389 domain-containing protein [bacterium]
MAKQSPDTGVDQVESDSEGGDRRARRRPKPKVFWRWLKWRAARGVDSLDDDIDHTKVIVEVEAEGALTGRYIFMVVMSCAIAVLGLLLSSPAVVIGAMLISPLMGPIMLLGFSACMVDFNAMKSALYSLTIGVLAALAISILIVALSPLREATPEILARTRPNFFDLLVAIFSGLAGGYSVIHRKGATIVGVAIATALMPPLAVVGFGIATGSVGIAGGAFFLFMTNLLAIALSVTGLAWLYGFATIISERFAKWQTGVVVIAFIGLSLPLGFALRDIAFQTRVANIVRSDALMPFKNTEAELSTISVTFPRGDEISVNQTVLTRSRIEGAEAELATHYEKVLGRPVQVRLSQVLVDESDPLSVDAVLQVARSSVAPLQKEVEALRATRNTAQDLRRAVAFKTLAIDIDSSMRTAVIVPAPDTQLPLGALREMEQVLLGQFEGWKIEVVPKRQPLPLIGFDSGTATISAEGRAAIDTITWALERWNVDAVEVEGRAVLPAIRPGTAGFASARRQNASLAQDRADAVAAALEAKGLSTTAINGYGDPDQAADERLNGVARYQAAAVRAVFTSLSGQVTEGEDEAPSEAPEPGQEPEAAPAWPISGATQAAPTDN